MKTFVALLLCAAVVYADNEQYKGVWQAWKAKFERVYEGAEEGYRFSVFCENAVKVAKHNLEESLGLHTYKLGLNKLADLSADEYRAIYSTELPRNTGLNAAKHVESPELPSSVDWRNSGAVTGVKDQGQCGSCWSFGATGALEGAYQISNGKLLSFSEQQQVDCNYNCYGCNGGWSEYCFYYWQNTRGANLESDYAYTARQGYCKTNNYQTYTTVSNYYSVTSGSESSLQSAVATSPVAIAIDASHYSFQLYSSGVYYESSCSSTNLDHAVLAAGYDSSSQGDYWIVKNSWGTGWGQAGYIWMARNRNNNCGVATDASYPVV